jgi:hypothetical protein
VERPAALLFVRLVEAAHVPRVDWLSKTDPFCKYVRRLLLHRQPRECVLLVRRAVIGCGLCSIVLVTVFGIRLFMLCKKG